jgi:hypothetical protein
MLKQYQIGVKWSFQPIFNPANPKLNGFGYGGDEYLNLSIEGIL